MSKELLSKEVAKIMQENNEKSPKMAALACAYIMAHYKGFNLKILDVNEFSSLADYYLIASTSNPTQSRAIADSISEELKKNGYTTRSMEGANDAEWILIDLGDLIVHIFQDSVRGFYDIENLWPEAHHVEIPESYYIGGEEVEEKGKVHSDFY